MDYSIKTGMEMKVYGKDMKTLTPKERELAFIDGTLLVIRGMKGIEPPGLCQHRFKVCCDLLGIENAFDIDNENENWNRVEESIYGLEKFLNDSKKIGKFMEMEEKFQMN